VAPPDKEVSGGDFPGGGAHSESAQNLIVSFNEVADLRSRQGRIAEVVVACDQFVPETRIGFCLDLPQAQIPDISFTE
jgi:hypothetical protein